MFLMQSQYTILGILVDGADNIGNVRIPEKLNLSGNDKIMSHAHKLCIHSGAMVSFKPKDLTTYIVPVVVKLFNMEEQFY